MVPPPQVLTVTRAASAPCDPKSSRAPMALIAANVAASRTTDTRFVAMPFPPPTRYANHCRHKPKAAMFAAHYALAVGGRQRVRDRIVACPQHLVRIFASRPKRSPTVSRSTHLPHLSSKVAAHQPEADFPYAVWHRIITGTILSAVPEAQPVVCLSATRLGYRRRTTLNDQVWVSAGPPPASTVTATV
jgi:hypothetical protein